MMILDGFKEQVFALAFSPDGRMLASAGDSRTVRVWDAVAGGALHLLDAPFRPVQSLGFSESGRDLIGAGRGANWSERLRGSSQRLVRAWDLEGRRTRATRQSWDAAAVSGARGRVGVFLDLRSAFLESVARVYDLERSGPTAELTIRSSVHTAAFAPGGRTVALFGMWTSLDEGDGRDPVLLWDPDVPARGLVYDPAVAPARGLKVLDTPETLRVRPNRPYGWGYLYGLGFSPDGRWVHLAHARGIAWWDAVDGRLAGTLPGVPRQRVPLAFAPAGNALATPTARDGEVRLLDLGGNPLADFETGISDLRALAFSPDGTRLAVGGKGAVAVLDLDL